MFIFLDRLKQFKKVALNFIVCKLSVGTNFKLGKYFKVKWNYEINEIHVKETKECLII